MSVFVLSRECAAGQHERCDREWTGTRGWGYRQVYLCGCSCSHAGRDANAPRKDKGHDHA